MFNPSRDIPDLTGRVFLITGGSYSFSIRALQPTLTSIPTGTAGLGKGTILSLAPHNPSHIFFTGRSTSSAESVISAVHDIAPNVGITFIPCDQDSLSSVQSACRTVLAQTSSLSTLILNAGIMAVPPSLTADGYEKHFGVNHVSHALFVKLLLPTLQQSESSRIITLTSIAAGTHPSAGIAFDTLHTTQNNLGGPGAAWMRYGQSKLANLLYARELARRYPSVLSLSVHPGVIATGLVTGLSFFNKLLLYGMFFSKMTSQEEGILNTLWATCVPREKVENGGFYEPVGVKGKLDKKMRDDDLARKLWDWTEKELAMYSL